MTDDLRNKYVACMICHALGDAIGYKNGEWEFQHTDDKIFEFIGLGGVNRLSLKDWRVSDDTILHIDIARALLSSYTSVNGFAENLVRYFLESLSQFTREGVKLRAPGINTMRQLIAIRDGRKWDAMKYDFEAGGSGASMRSLCIGLAYYKPEDLNMLIQISIESSRVTHNSVIGYLGGLVAALFTSYAVQNIPIVEWPFKLMDLYHKGTILNYIKAAGRDVERYEEDEHVFFNKWDFYIRDKFSSSRDVIKKRTTNNLFWRSKYYYDNFRYKPKDKVLPEKNIYPPGAGGDDSVIIAYDALIDAGDQWETLIFYAMLHRGDTDTTGCIAGGWYGIMYGMNDIPEINVKHLEYKEKLKDLGSKLYDKFHK